LMEYNKMSQQNLFKMVVYMEKFNDFQKRFQ